MAIDKNKSWLDARLNTSGLSKVLMTEYWIPKNINFLWSFGVILAALFKILVISGIFLLCYYKPDANLAFDSVNQTIMMEVEYGWLFRTVHAVGASVVFLVIYIHMFVAIYYGSYKNGREVIWITGFLLLSIFSAEGFSGYMLPWGQMSYWAAQVITNLFGAIPVIGPDLVIWIRGNYVVADATLTRFFALHVLVLPLVIMGIIGAHMYSLRIPHVNNQDGEEIDFDAEAEKFKAGNKKESKVIPFWPTFLAEDFFVLSAFMIFFFYLVFYHSGFAMDPINFNPADSMQTPPHIYPEWYFLWSYEVLRGFFFSMNMGLIAFAIANVIFALMPWLDRDPRVRPASKRPLFKIWFWALLVVLIGLTVYGKLPPTGPNAWVGFVLSVAFLIMTLVVLPIITKIEAGRK